MEVQVEAPLIAAQSERLDLYRHWADFLIEVSAVTPRFAR